MFDSISVRFWHNANSVRYFDNAAIVSHKRQTKKRPREGSACVELSQDIDLWEKYFARAILVDAWRLVENPLAQPAGLPIEGPRYSGIFMCLDSKHDGLRPRRVYFERLAQIPQVCYLDNNNFVPSPLVMRY
jgi:hypothetical protein